MNVLITGSTGFLGQTLINVLSNNNTIFELSKSDSLRTVRLDKEVPEICQVFDLVVHTAGKAHSIPKNEIEKNKFFEVNVQGTQNLIRGLEITGVPKQFVFISSVAVYGRDYGSDINESENLAAIDPYGLSKIQAEQLIKDWCQQKNVVCTILRLPLLVGKNPPGNLGAMLKGIKKGYYFNIGGGTAKKSMVLAEDVSQFIPKLASMGGTYNLTDGQHPTFEALSQSIAKKKIFNLPLFIAKTIGFIGDILGERAPINSLKIKKITSDLTFDDSKARELGWNPKSVLEYLKNNDL
jgi:nucleoside-diphosphate-sugar epimerase